MVPGTLVLCTRAPYGVLKTPPRTGLRWFALTPVGASRAPSQAGSLRETFDRARGAYFAPGELGERPAVARRAGNRAYFARRCDRGVFLLVPFLCTSKEKEPAVGQPPTSNTRAKPARQNNITPHPNPLPQGERGSRNGGATPQVHAAAGRTIA